MDQNNLNEKQLHPSAELLQQTCRDEYMRLIKTYDAIYTKVNIVLAFCGVVLAVVVKSIDFTIWKSGCLKFNFINAVKMTTPIFSLLSIAMMLVAVLLLLGLMRSKPLVVFDASAIRTEKVYNIEPDKSALWLIDKYTIAIEDLRNTIAEKQGEFDKTIKYIIYSVISYVIYIVISKGVY